MVKLNKNDVLTEKKKQLSKLQPKHEFAVFVAQKTVNNLETISRNMEENIVDIDTYQSELEETKAELQRSKEKNDKILLNFKALLEME